jgi:carbon storage regulator
MLVLSRRRGEGFSVGDDTEIVVLDVDGCTVKIGITAPKQVLIMRDELKTVREQNESASRLPASDRLDALVRKFRKTDL